MPLIAGQEEHAIYCFSSYGPIFGGGHDLCIPGAPNSSNCSSRLNGTYQCPAGHTATTFLAGTQYFTINEMEVFGFDK